VADLIQRGGFPPVHLSEIDFQAMYEQQQQQACRRGTAYRHPVIIEASGPCATGIACYEIVAIGAGAWARHWRCSAAASRPGQPPGASWARDAAQAVAMQAQRENRCYLSGGAAAGLRVLGPLQAGPEGLAAEA